MEHVSLLNTIAAALAVAFLGGLAARLARLPAIVGYMFAGIAISPFTTWYGADVGTIRELAELGVIFLMFGVGLHFNLADLLAVKGVAIPGSLARLGVVTAAGIGISAAFGFGMDEGMVFGLAIGIASTVVAIRALEERGDIDSVPGRIAIGCLIVEDLAIVLVLTLMPVLASDGSGGLFMPTLIALGKAGVFLALMFTLGARVVPWGLAHVARTGSRELFILATVGGALGIATGASLFGVSVALGAFIAGVVVSETETSHQAAADVVPFREAFAVLFFVSTGMLFEPRVVIEHLGLFALTLATVVFGKSLLTLAIVAMWPYSARTSLTVAVSLAQVGEFSLIVAQQAVSAEVMSATTYNMVLAVAVASITLNPLLFAAIPRAEVLLRRLPAIWHWLDHQGEMPDIEAYPIGHVVIAGYGRVGQLSGSALSQLGERYTVIEANLPLVRRLHDEGITAVWGDAADLEVLATAGVSAARALLLAVPDETTVLLATRNALSLNPALPVIARASNGSELQPLRDLGAREVVVPEYEGGAELVRQLLITIGHRKEEAQEFSQSLRDIQYGGYYEAADEATSNRPG